MSHNFPRYITNAAARWVAREDRALSPAEADAYRRWLRADPRHPAAVARCEVTFKRLQLLHATAIDDTVEDGVSLGRKPVLWHRPWPWAAAAALLIIVVGWWLMPVPIAPATSTPLVNPYLRLTTHLELPDGSAVDLKAGTHLEIDYMPQTRLVRLQGEEAYFSIVHNPDRPFVVEAAGLRIEDVGTAFNLKVLPKTVEVLVTDGTVRIVLPVGTPSTDIPVDRYRMVHAGEYVIVPRQLAAYTPLQLTRYDQAQIKTALAWQAPHLQFTDTALSTVIAQFNKYNAGTGRPQLELGNPALGALRVGGSFQADNAEGFARLLNLTMNIGYRDAPNNHIILGGQP